MDEIDNNDDFSGFIDTDVSDVDFFTVEDNPEPDEKSKKGTPGSEDSKNNGAEEEEETEEIEDDNLFNQDDNEDDDPGEGTQGGDDDEEEEEEQETPEGNSITTLSVLQDKGLIEYELEEGETLTDEKAAEILEDSLDTMFEDRLEELFENVPDIVKEINKFVIKGGDINAYLQAVSVQNQTGLTKDLDLEEEANQELVIRHGLKEEGYDDEYITAQIEFLKDSNRLKKHSETHYKKWDEKRKEEQKSILKSQEQVQKREKEQRRALKGKVTTFLKETEEVTGFTVTKQDRKVLPNYMSDRNVKLENGGQITAMQRDLMRVLNSPTGSVQIAKLLQAASEDGELNFEEIKKETTTKVAKQVRDNVRRDKKRIITNSGGGKNSKPKRPLADYFN